MSQELKSQSSIEIVCAPGDCSVNYIKSLRSGEVYKAHMTQKSRNK
jgi:hypothetical protein